VQHDYVLGVPLLGGRREIETSGLDRVAVHHNELVMHDGVSIIYAQRNTLVGEERRSRVTGRHVALIHNHFQIDAALMGIDKSRSNRLGRERIRRDSDG
jgi:hypothetical protein